MLCTVASIYAQQQPDNLGKPGKHGFNFYILVSIVQIITIRYSKAYSRNIMLKVGGDGGGINGRLCLNTYGMHYFSINHIKIIVIAIVIFGIGCAAAVHVFYKPLDMLWYIALRKLNLA